MNSLSDNSSSGIIEAPTLGIPTINIGDRQKGRITGDTVINCDDRKETIKNAIDEALSKKFSKRFKIAKNPYSSGDASKKIVEKLVMFPLENILVKKFYDLKELI